MEPKPGTVPSLGFAAGAGTLAFYAWPELTAAGVEPAVGIAALSAVIAPFALVGRALIARAVAFINSNTNGGDDVQTQE